MPGADTIFISYASHDVGRVLPIARHLEAAGVPLWRDHDRILGGGNYGPEIARAIRESRWLMLMCTDASMRSRNVKQEIQLAWKYQVPYLPLLLEPISFPEQLEYWLEGWQRIEVLDRPPEQWLSAVLASVTGSPAGIAELHQPNCVFTGLAGLRALASYTDQIWPLPAEVQHRGFRGELRDLGAPSDGAQYAFRLGSRVRLAIEADRDCHLLLLDEGTSGKTYCLCPSAFAPDTRVRHGRTYLPQGGAVDDAFTVTGDRAGSTCWRFSLMNRWKEIGCRRIQRFRRAC